MGARTINTYTGSLQAFIRWCIQGQRIAENPLVTVARLNERADVRRERRALSEAELQRLLVVAELRPLADYGRAVVKRPKEDRKKKRDTWIREKLTPDTIAECCEKARQALQKKPEYIAHLEKLGRERRLIYLTAVLTGLRRGELEQLTWRDLSLDGPKAWLTVRAAVAKNGEAATLPIHSDLAVELGTWRVEQGEPLDGDRVFRVPKELVKALRRDLRAAGIDTTGVDVHALRHTTATRLARAGIAPRTAQELMRHSDIRLTFGTYTDPRLLDTGRAVESLPRLTDKPMKERIRATGTCGGVSPRLGKLGAQLGGKAHQAIQSGAISFPESGSKRGRSTRPQVSLDSRLSNPIQNSSTKRAIGFEPTTSSLGT